MPDCVQLSWHDNALRFMEHEIEAAQRDQRIINHAVICEWVRYIRTTKKTKREQQVISAGLDLLLEAMPNDAATLLTKLEVKTLYHQLSTSSLLRRSRSVRLSAAVA